MDTQIVERLSRASVSKYYMPEVDVDWSPAFDPAAAPAMPLELVSLYGLPELDRLSPTQRNRLVHHEIASLYSIVIRLENVLMRNFSRLVQQGDPLDPLFPYFLHEVEEEARHNRMFIRLIRELDTGAYPARGVMRRLEFLIGWLITRSRATFLGLTLTAEVIPDYFHQRCLDTEPVHPVLRQVSLVHRVEEARHIQFAREYIRDAFASAPRGVRFLVAWTTPLIARLLFDLVVPPRVYVRAGVARNRWQAMRLWLRARSTPHRVELRQRAIAPLLEIYASIGALRRDTRWLWRRVGLAPAQARES